MNCTTKSLYKSIEACPGKKNLPGIRRRLYYKNKAAIATFPKLPDIGAEGVANMAELAQLQGDFTLAAEEFWQFIDLKDEASNVTYESVGEDGSKLFNNQANAIVSGQDDEVKGFARQVINTDMVFVYQQRDGKFCVLGNEMFVGHVSPSGDTGAEATAAVTSTFTIEVKDECPIPTYTGKLYIAAGKYIDCATGDEEKDPDPDPGE
jgi:hypothetical protein